MPPISPRPPSIGSAEPRQLASGQCPDHRGLRWWVMHLVELVVPSGGLSEHQTYSSKGFALSPVSRCQKPSGDLSGFRLGPGGRRLGVLPWTSPVFTPSSTTPTTRQSHPRTTPPARGHVRRRPPSSNPSAWQPSECLASIRVRACPPSGRCHSDWPLSLGWVHQHPLELLVWEPPTDPAGSRGSS